MACKHPNPSGDPPAASSEEHDDDEEVEESEDDDQQQQHAQPDGSETEEEEEDNDEEEEDDDEEDATKVKAPPNTPAPEKPAAAASKKENAASPMPLVSLKRPAEAEGSKSRGNKKLKAEEGRQEEEEGGASEKKSGFVNRLWTEQDEIAILKGMIAFRDKEGVDPNSDPAAFHEFVKKDLSVVVSRSQLMDKVRRLKKKYRTNAEKKGEDPVFTRPHEAKAFQLSKKVWGGLVLETRKSPPPKKNIQANGQCKEKQREGTFSQLYPFLSMSLQKGGVYGADLISMDWGEAMASYLMYIDKSKLEELEEEWKKQILAENDLYLKRSSLVQKQFQLLRG